MVMNRSVGIGWYHAVLVAALSWVWLFRPSWVLAVVVLILVVHRSAVSSWEAEPWRSSVVMMSAFLALVYGGGWAIAGGWVVVAVGVGVSIWSFPKIAGWSRPDVIDVAAGTTMAVAFVMQPDLLLPGRGGWVSPIILILGARRLAATLSGLSGRRSGSGALQAPTRDVRGTLSFSGAVAGSDGLPRTVPLDLEIRAGASLAILCDDGVEGRDLVDGLTGRRSPVDGQVCIDGVPPGTDESLMAVVGLAEPFMVGSLWDNVAALCEAHLNSDQKAAVREACALSEVEEALAGAPIKEDGRPLDPHHRLMVQLARVVVSPYRLLVVLDPMVSVNPVRSELWRAGVVRTSVGRTAVWITPDRELAQRADQVVVLRHGTLRPLKPQTKGGE
ncbi:MAG: hypothetical protein ABFS37_08880 [Acidobacteriota bacterium]